MKKILIASYNLGYGGIETSLVNLIKNMDLKKYDITLVLEKKEGVFLKDLPKEINIKEYRVSNCKNIFIRKFLNLLKRVKWIFNNYNKYDSSICYATYSGPCGFAARTTSKNRILYIHSNYYEAFGRDKSKTLNFFNNLKINNYEHLVFVSNEVKNDLINLFPNIKDKSITINNLIDCKKIIDLSKKDIDIIKDDKKVFLFVGRLDESSKRLTSLLEVAKKCKEKQKKCMFWVLGTGPDEQMYKKIAKDNTLNNVIFFGAKKNPYPYIKLCDYVILTSYYEGFPVVYNESIILNKPIITTVDVSDEVISINNRFGIVCKKDVNSIYKTILNVLKKDFIINEKVNFESINKNRVKLIEEILESKND